MTWRRHLSCPGGGEGTEATPSSAEGQTLRHAGRTADGSSTLLLALHQEVGGGTEVEVALVEDREEEEEEEAGGSAVASVTPADCRESDGDV